METQSRRNGKQDQEIRGTIMTEVPKCEFLKADICKNAKSTDKCALCMLGKIVNELNQITQTLERM